MNSVMRQVVKMSYEEDHRYLSRMPSIRPDFLSFIITIGNHWNYMGDQIRCYVLADDITLKMNCQFHKPHSTLFPPPEPKANSHLAWFLGDWVKRVGPCGVNVTVMWIIMLSDIIEGV